MRDMTLWAAHLRRHLFAIAPLVGLMVGLLVLAPLESLEQQSPVQGTFILDAGGNVLWRDTTDGLLLPLQEHEIPSNVIEATIATEDQRFYWHPGVDPIAIVRSLLRWHEAPSGASTLSQQLARRLYLGDASPTITRKLHEAWIALQLDARHSKSMLLTSYLNTIYYGHGAYGIEAAARTYFGVSARDLDLAQAAFLVGLPQAPSAYDPIEHFAVAQERQRYVLDRMVKSRRITPAAAHEAAVEELTIRSAFPEQDAPHFVQYVRDQLREQRPDLADRKSLRIETTLDRGVQRDAQRIVRTHLHDLEGRNAGDASVVVLDPRSGAVIAMVGSPDFWRNDSGQVNLALQPRQPGSALKPFLYAAALEHGYTAASPLLDVPSAFMTDDGLYEPLDNDLSFRGPISMRVALASSLNIPAVRTIADVGTAAFVEVAQQVNLISLGDNERSAGLGLALGTAEVRLLDLAAAYQVFANGGRWTQPFAIARVTDAHGDLLYQHGPPQPRQALTPASAFIVSDILSDPDAREAGFGGKVHELETSMYAGVKTGSTSGGRDAWTVGFSSERVVGVWVGNADSSPMVDVASISGAAPIWQAVMESTMRGLTSTRPTPPADIEARTVCAGTGQLPGAACPYPTKEYFIKGTAPDVVERSFTSSSRPGVLAQDIPNEALGWAQALGIEQPVSRVATGVVIVAPANGAVLYTARELARQELLLRAAVPSATTSVTFRLDGRVVGTTEGIAPYLVTSLIPGSHDLEVQAVVNGTIVSARSVFQVATR